MRIAIDCRMLGSGGIGSYIKALIPLFIENNNCILIGEEKNISEFKNNTNTEIIYCDIKPFSVKEMLCFPKDILKKINSCDIFYTPYCNIPNGIKIPVYSTIHDVVFLDIPDLAGKIGTFARKLFYKRAIRKSKAIFTVSEFSKNQILKHLPTKKQIIVTYNALPHWFDTNIDSNIKKEDFILFVGNIKKHKGLHTLIQAYKLLLKNDFAGKLMIVGNADNFRTSDDSITSEINELKDKILFTGRISDKELKEFYCKAKCLVQPSLYEGFGMPPLEAISLGTNAVISDIPVFKEIYQNLPVTFFQSENATDLSEKIKETYDKSSPVITNNPYSFERTYKIIFDELNK